MTRALVVEDEESFSDALSYMLRKEGFEVAVTATRPDALDELFERNGADLVLLDLAPGDVRTPVNGIQGRAVDTPPGPRTGPYRQVSPVPPVPALGRPASRSVTFRVACGPGRA